MSDDDKELTIIMRAAYRWDLYAALSPIIFLVIVGLSIYIGFIAEDLAFYIGVFVFAVTSIVWWVWTIITIRKLVLILNRVGNNMNYVKEEIKEARKEIAELNKINNK